MSDIKILIDALKKEDKDVLKRELFDKGNVLADEQKLIRSEKKVMLEILRDIEKLRGRVSSEEFTFLMNKYNYINGVGEYNYLRNMF